MTFEWLLALRYLRSSHRPAVLRLVTYLSVVGVAAGVGTLVIALSMNTGFRQAVEERLLGVTAHINIKGAAGRGIREYRSLAERLRAVAGVKAASPAIYQTVLLSAAGRARGVVVKGVKPELERESNELLRKVMAGAADFAVGADGLEAILLGRLLAQEMNLAPGDSVTITSPQGRLTPFGMIPRSRRFRVVGVYDSGFYDYDANWGVVTLASAQGLAGSSDVASVVEVRISDPDEAPVLASRLVAQAGENYVATTWMDENRALFRALRLEKLVTAIFIGLITFVAGLNILVVLAMTVGEKARDVAVLMAMGARPEQIARTYLWLGLTIGLVGTCTGLVLGYGSAWAADAFRWIRLDPEIYAIPYVPFRLSWSDACWIAAAALLISAGATFYPARSAARIRPVEILRFE